MKTSKKGIDLIKQFEGCRLKAYKPVAAEKYYTIGWGHYGEDVGANMVISQEQADAMLVKDLERFENYVSRTGLKLNQNQFDALVSFAYNCGPGNLNTLVKGRSLSQIADAMLLYNKGANKKVLAGLERRRKMERDLFLSGAPLKETKKVDVDVVKQIYLGSLGSGAVRKQKVEALGYDYEEVREKVNFVSKKIGSLQALKKECGEYWDLVLSKL